MKCGILFKTYHLYSIITSIRVDIRKLKENQMRRIHVRPGIVLLVANFPKNLWRPGYLVISSLITLADVLRNTKFEHAKLTSSNWQIKFGLEWTSGNDMTPKFRGKSSFTFFEFWDQTITSWISWSSFSHRSQKNQIET